MQYSPKLKKAAEEIKQILEKYDIGAILVLHTPGNSEYVMKIDPSYSCAFIDGEMLRVRAKLQQDFKGDKTAWEKKITDTANMLSLLTDTGQHIVTQVGKIKDLVYKTVDAEDTDLGHSSHTTQNN